MTAKHKAIWGGSIAGVTQFVGWFATLPPESQETYVQPILELLPVHWRTAIGGFMKALSGVAMLYAFYQASHSGPGTPPKNPPL